MKTVFTIDDHYYIQFKMNNRWHTGDTFQLPQGEWQLIGTVTKDTINFDCEPYVEKFYDFDGIPAYIDSGRDKDLAWNTAEQAFRSTIEAKTGKTFVNPLPKPTCDCETEFDRDGCPQECWHWINVEANLIHKAVILKKII